MNITNEKTGEVIAEGVSPSNADNLYFSLYVEPLLGFDGETLLGEPELSQEEFDAMDIKLEYTNEERSRFVQGNIAEHFAPTRGDRGGAAMSIAGVNNDAISLILTVVSAILSTMDKPAKDKVVKSLAKSLGSTDDAASADLDSISNLSVALPFNSKKDPSISGALTRLNEMNVKVKEELTK